MNLYDIPPDRITDALRGAVDAPFRARQIADWLYHKDVASFEEMRNLPRELREGLADHFSIDLPEVRERSPVSADGSQKYLFSLSDGSLIESVYMPMGDRTSLCLSSQAGCAVGCTFCVTGFFGAGRNLSAAEMIGQVKVIRREKNIPSQQMNIVFMGMGEPLLNLDNLETVLEILALEISPRRITVSTSGITPALERFGALEHRPNLAVSVNAPDQKRREEIMPITKKYPLDELVAALEEFPVERGREITAEYVLLRGYNDSPDDARALARLLRNVRCKINAIPFNPDPNLPPWMARPDDRAIDRFVDTLAKAGATVTVRRSKGDQIAAACGQLRGKTEKRKRAGER